MLYICSYFCSSFLYEHSISSKSRLPPREKVVFTLWTVLHLIPVLQRLIPLFSNEACLCITYCTKTKRATDHKGFRSAMGYWVTHKQQIILERSKSTFQSHVLSSS